MPVGAFELVGARKVGNDLRLLADRMSAPVLGMNREFEILEEAEKALFASYGGKYHETGALEASLTQSEANGAIRRWHGNSIEFGTSIWYAMFQRTIGGPSGKPRGRVRTGPSKILKFTPATRRAAVELVADRIMGRVAE